MSKTETVKALIKPWGYIFGGMSLIITTLFMLGWMMDQLVKTFGTETMPFLASLVPLIIFLTGVVWGGIFVWKGALTVDISFDIFCKWLDRIVLNRISRKTRMLVGGPPVLAGVLIIATAMIRLMIESGLFHNGSASLGITMSPLWPIGLGLLVFGLIVTHDIKPKRREQSIEKT